MALIVLAATSGVHAQETDAVPDAVQAVPQQLTVDLQALMIATRATVQCAVIDPETEYLTPVELVGAEIRLQEMIAQYSASSETAADDIARSREEAPDFSCGDPALNQYLDFGRQLGRDVFDIAMTTWKQVDVASCNYFVDDGFLAAAARAREVAEDTTLDGPDNRIQFIEQRAAAWTNVFQSNCNSLYFDPVDTLPGRIALVLPTP